jgi:secernin
MNPLQQVAPFSCDTMVALPSATAGGQVIFGKNSDRPQEEAQPLVLRPQGVHEQGDAGAQFVKVPQARETYRHVGSRPFWCAGYEHGFNEHQVVIGNEALPTKLQTSSEPKLIGMELVRFALERASTAGEAVEVITGLVSEFGQGKFENSTGIRTYDNSYIVADPHQAFIIEAVGHDWAVRRVENAATISNVCTLGGPADRVSPGAKRHATEAGLFEMGFGDDFNFSNVFADRADSTSGIARQCRTETLINQRSGNVDVRTVMKVLSDHSDGANPGEPFVEDVNGQVSVCLHRTEGDAKGTSAATIVADLCATGERLPLYWCGLYSPCMTLYLPVFVEGELPKALSLGGETPSDDSPWWQLYRITQSGLSEGASRREQIRTAWRPLQDELLESAYVMAARGRELLDANKPEQAKSLLSGYMSESFVRAMEIARSLVPQVAVR